MQKQIKSLGCPLDKTCQREDDEYIYRCPWYIKLRGKNSNTGEDVDEFGCAVAWIPILQIETSQQTRQAGAAIESFRNEMVKQNDILISHVNEQKLIGVK